MHFYLCPESGIGVLSADLIDPGGAGDAKRPGGVENLGEVQLPNPSYTGTCRLQQNDADYRPNISRLRIGL